jgi:hypothetical protein
VFLMDTRKLRIIAVMKYAYVLEYSTVLRSTIRLLEAVNENAECT